MKILTTILHHKMLLLSLIMIELFLFMILSWDKQSRVKEYLADITNSFDAEYSVLYRSFQDKAFIAFDSLIDKKDIKQIMKQVINASPSQQNMYRKKLYDLLFLDYMKLKEYGFKQVHFHLPNNHSFLRMHAPQKYGDDLSSFRKTVVYVNNNHKKISGFEEGFANDGYRFVFPLIDKKEYLGSVELSFSVHALIAYLKDGFLDTHFIIAKKTILSTKMNPYLTNAMDPNFVIDKRYVNNNFLLQYDKNFHNHYEQDKKHSFSLTQTINNKRYIKTFIPIFNPVTHDLSAYLITLSYGKYLNQISHNFWIAFLSLGMMIMLIFTRYIKGRMFKQKIERQNKKLSLANFQLKTIIDSQNNMIVLTDGIKMVDANQKVLDFFGFTSINEMIHSYQCICNLFLKHKDYFHLNHVPKDTNWINYMQILPFEQRVVNMIGKDMISRAFQVNIAEYGNGSGAVISFNDITDVLLRQRDLKYKAEHDRLTDIYNRQKIDEVLHKLCQFSSRRKEMVGIIMFDIDHFKKVNDNYGHDIGDEVLKAIATLVKNNIREEDIFGRWGGEEFILILRHTTLEDTYKKALRLCKDVEKFHRENIPHITISLGVTSLYKNDHTKSLFKRADLALYQAKKQGRNCVVCFTEEIREEVLVVAK